MTTESTMDLPVVPAPEADPPADQAKPVTAIKEYNKTEAALTALRKRLEGVAYDLSTVKGMEIAKADRATLRGLRTGLEAKRKELKAPALEYSKRIDAEAKRITEALTLLEDPIDKQIKAEETRKQNEKEERERLERERVTKIHARIASIRAYLQLANECRGSERVATLLARMDAEWLAFDFENDFEEFWEEAQRVRDDVADQLKALISIKQAEEAERARVKAEQAAETERLAKVKADQEAETKRLADERADLDAQRAAFAAEMEEHRAAQEKKSADALALQAVPAADTKPPLESFAAEPANAADSFLAFIGQTAAVDLDETAPVTPVRKAPRPTDGELMDALADYYNVSDFTVLAWLKDMDLAALEARFEGAPA